MCKTRTRVYRCGHFTTSTTYCTAKRHNAKDACDPPKADDASTTGVYCGWKSCDKKASGLRDENPDGKPKVCPQPRFDEKLTGLGCRHALPSGLVKRTKPKTLGRKY